MNKGWFSCCPQIPATLEIRLRSARSICISIRSNAMRLQKARRGFRNLASSQSSLPIEQLFSDMITMVSVVLYRYRVYETVSTTLEWLPTRPDSNVIHSRSEVQSFALPSIVNPLWR